ncbi:MAG: hypothetical protein AMXMBFR53_07390 [Gemmatimonadota bacterium]
MRSLPAVLLLLAAAAPGAAGQDPFRTDSTGAFVLERAVRERWVHEGQHPAFVPRRLRTDVIHVRRLSGFGGRGGGSLSIRVLNREASLLLEDGNRVSMATVDLPRLTYHKFDVPEERAETRRRMLAGEGLVEHLPYARLWEVPFVVTGGTLSPGTEWSDTLSFSDDPGEGLSERLSGVWRKRVVGDTLLGARRLPVVRVEAEVRYRATEVMRDAAGPGSFTVERDLQGTVTGFAIVDTVLGTRAGGADTAAWAGTAVLGTPEGRSFPSQVRYDGTRTWSLRDSLTWADSVREARRRNDRGMVRAPSTPLQERLAAGDAVAADSLLARWRTAGDPDERYELEQVLWGWWARGRERADGLRDTLARLRREAGDTATGILNLDRWTSEALTGERARHVLPYLDDLGRAWKLGQVPSWVYTELAAVLLEATPILQPDSTRWRCAPEACRAFIAALESASEPRLRDAALVGAFARDPARWVDRIRARADSGSHVVGRAMQLAGGVGAPWPAAPQDPVPPPGADWRAWLSWMGGTIRFEGSHRDALLMYTARTGRDPVAELRDAWPPPSDSARLVLGAVLSGMGAGEEPTAAGLAREFLSANPARITLAGPALHQLVGKEGAAPDPLVAGDLLAAVLDSIMAGGDSPWPAVEGLPRRPGERVLSRYATTFHGVEDVPVFIEAESLPPGFAARVEPPLQVVDSATWAARPTRAGGVIIEVHPMRAAGDFVELAWTWTAFEARAPDESPVGYAGGGALVLLRTGDGWRVVDTRAWIT